MDSFFQDENYKIPNTSNYMKFEDGSNVFRVLSSAITGYEYFKADNKPVRSKEPFDTIPSDIKKEGKIKHFWAFVVYNETAKRIQIAQINQSSIQKAMQAYIKNPKWGNPRDYDFIIDKSGSGLETEYAITVNPKSPLDESIIKKFNDMKLDLTALYEGLDPFTVDKN